MSFAQIATIGVLAVTMVGCATAPQKTAFNRELATTIHSIAIVQEPNQSSYPARILVHAGQNFGLIGALAAEADMASKSRTLTQVVAPYKLNIQQRLVADLTSKLTAEGYVIESISLPEGTAAKKALDVATTLTKSDGVLVLTSASGYVSANHTAAYQPQVRVAANLYERATKKQLYNEAVNYGFATANDDAIMITADEKYSFKDMAAIKATPEAVAQGLIEGVAPVAERIASDLKK